MRSDGETFSLNERIRNAGEFFSELFFRDGQRLQRLPRGIREQRFLRVTDDRRERAVVVEKNGELPVAARDVLNVLQCGRNHTPFNNFAIRESRIEILLTINYKLTSMNRLIVVSNRLPFALDSTGEDL